MKNDQTSTTLLTDAGNVSKSTRNFALIFCIALACLFLVGAYLSFPFHKTTSVALLSLNELQEQARKSHKTYVLNTEDYEVLSKVGEESIADRFTMKKHTLVFYRILVTPSTGAPYTMVVRVEEEDVDLAQGRTVTLQGMISRTDEKLNQLDYTRNATLAQNTDLCLNTEIDSQTISLIKTIILALLSIGCVCLTARILKRSKQAEKDSFEKREGNI